MSAPWKSLLPAAGGTKRLIADFADQVGMVYFGYVSQRSDEHHIVRGLTVSTKHTDDHYCIGTYEGYDVVFVERSDTLRSGRKHIWHIMEFDLKTTEDIPHVFIGSGTHGHGFHELLETKYSNLQTVDLGATAEYPHSFKVSFNTHVSMSHQLALEQLLTPAVAEQMATHFKGLVIEIIEHSLYVYSEKSQLSLDLLMTMLRNGKWLAQQIDENSRRAQVAAG